MKRGYLTPQVQPDQFSCARVFYPSDPLYLSALLGSLSYLATWAAWEREVDKRGRLAAQLWKDALDLTIESLSSGCDSQEICELCEMTKDELQQYILEAFEAMTINNTIYNGCGCCGSSGQPGSASTELENDPLDSSEWNPADLPDPDPDAINDAQKCSFANYLVYALRLTALKAVEHTDTMTVFNSFMDALFDFMGTGLGDIWKISFKLSYERYVWVMSKLNGHVNAVSLLSEMFDANYNDYVCVLFSAADETEAKTALDAALDNTIGDLLIRSSLKNIAASLPYQLLFAPLGSIPVPPGFSGRSCCGSAYDVPVVPAFPATSCLAAGITIQKAVVDFATFDDSAATFEWDQDLSTGIVTFENYVASSSSFSSPGVLFNFGTPDAAFTRIGWVIEILENNSNAVSVKFAGRGLDGVALPKVWAQMSLASERDCLSTILQDVFGSEYYDFGAYDISETVKLESDRTRASTGTNLLSLTFRVWDILRAV